MRVIILLKCLIILLFCSSTVLLAQEEQAADTGVADTVQSKSATEYVQVRSAAIRAEPKPWAKLLESAEFGAAVTVLEPADSWPKVTSASGVEGYIHKSALSKKMIVLENQENRFADLGDDVEVVLAGKGFTSDIESAYSEKDSSLNYAAVDTLEARTVSEETLQAFRTEGQLE